MAHTENRESQEFLNGFKPISGLVLLCCFPDTNMGQYISINLTQTIDTSIQTVSDGCATSRGRVLNIVLN